MSTAAQEIENFFAGGVPAVKFQDQAYGTVIGGEIVADPRMQQQRDYTTGDPVTYPDGNPAMQMVLIVQTDLRDPNVDGDDGQRAFYIRGQMRQAIGEALRKSGSKSPQRGGILQIKYLRDEPVTLKNGRPGNPQKIYAARYTPPANHQAGQFFDDQTAPASIPSATRSAIERPDSIPQAVWASMSTDQQQQIAAATRGLGEPARAQAGRLAEEPPF